VTSIKLLVLFGIRRNFLRSGTVNLVPIYKYGVKTEYGNYTGVSTLPITYKILSYLLLSRLTPYSEEIVRDHQCGFRSFRSTIDHVFCTRQILEKKMGIQRSSASAIY
jgi:hypothetical protein